ncbi:MAG TPA: hypothetical protein VJQ79_11065, partial [Acidimicrobiia bacterium]|nr:hypothetical protein [Acidimicrobiia bacterium]
DALAFSYEALPVLAKKTVLATATSLRGKLRKGLAGAERPPMADAQDSFEATPIPAPPPEETRSDSGEIPQPTRKLRDLIQAAVRSNAGDSPSPEGNHRPSPEGNHRPSPEGNQWPSPEGNDWKGPDLTLREVILTVADPTPQPGPPAPAGPEFHEAGPDVESGSAGVVEPVSEDPSLTDLLAFGDLNAQQVRPTFDFSPDFAEPAALNQTIERLSLRGLPDSEANGFDDGDTLGERPAERFGWVRASEEAKPALLVEPPPPLVRSLDTLIEEVRNGAMSPAQIGAITDLIRAVAETVENKNRR